MALITIEDLTFSYPEGKKRALNGVSLEVEQGQFVILCGKSGCGKSTLLRHFKTVLAPHGKRSGAVRFRGRPLEEISFREQSQSIGFVMQNPENQIVTDKVWHELAFGLESLGYRNETIRLRVAEMASWFGIQEWYRKSTGELSGGQKQLLNLAAVMAMQPDVLILDEPTSQLDPIAATEFLASIKKINDEIGVTVILSEHRLEEAFPLSHKAIVMEDGKIQASGPPAEIGRKLETLDSPMLYAMPTPMRIWLALEKGEGDRTRESPIHVRTGRAWLEETLGRPNGYLQEAVDSSRTATSGSSLRLASEKTDSGPVIVAKDIWFRYEKKGNDILRGMRLAVNQGELYCIVGGNGTGKTTALGILSGLHKPYRGKVRIAGINPTEAGCAKVFEAGVSLLPQDPQTLFTRATILDDLREAAARAHLTEKEDAIERVVETAEIRDILGMHPYDVSGGEQQRAALAKILLTEPKLLLMDEPTKGMDSFFKRKFAQVLKKLREGGMTVVMVSHDIEFCAAYADRCALFFDGGVVTEECPAAFFSGNSFYTTAANRMSRAWFPAAMTVEDVIRQCRQAQSEEAVI